MSVDKYLTLCPWRHSPTLCNLVRKCIRRYLYIPRDAQSDVLLHHVKGRLGVIILARNSDNSVYQVMLRNASHGSVEEGKWVLQKVWVSGSVLESWHRRKTPELRNSICALTGGQCHCSTAFRYVSLLSQLSLDAGTHG
jgi:hypothetical protein